jgi:hypothetical protein
MTALTNHLRDLEITFTGGLHPDMTSQTAAWSHGPVERYALPRATRGL